MRSSRFLLLSAAVAGALVACGGSARQNVAGGFATAAGSISAGGSADGSVNGTTFSVGSVTGGLTSASATSTCSLLDGGQTCTTTSSGQTVGILLSSRAEATCAFVQSQAASGNGLFLSNNEVLELTITNASGPVVPGTYSLASTNETGAPSAISVSAVLTGTDSSCNEASEAWGTSGAIVLTEVTSSSLSGTFAVTFGGEYEEAQGSLTGSFAVDVCYLADGGIAAPDGGPSVCE